MSAAPIVTRGFVDGCSVRSIDREKRTATFVVTTENGVETWNGREYLLMAGCDLTRYLRNPVVQDSHDRSRAESTIGRAPGTAVVGRELVAPIEFATTSRAETVWNLVSSGFLRGASIGYSVQKEQVVADGQEFTAGTLTVQGPARVGIEWELYEVSVCPVGADPDALLRSYVADAVRHATEGVPTMAQKDKSETPVTPPPVASPETAAAPPAAPEVRAPETPAVQKPAVEVPEEVRTRSIRALAGDGLKDVAQRCILDGKSIEEARVILLAEFTKRSAPAGTAEPPVAAPPAAKVPSVKDISDDMLLRTLAG